MKLTDNIAVIVFLCIVFVFGVVLGSIVTEYFINSSQLLLYNAPHKGSISSSVYDWPCDCEDHLEIRRLGHKCRKEQVEYLNTLKK